jgi:hypothetical protein
MNFEPAYLDRKPSAEKTTKFVVVIPVLNEEAYIENASNPFCRRLRRTEKSSSPMVGVLTAHAALSRL